MLDREGRKWTEDETILALCLYQKLPCSKHDKRTPEVIELANILHRSVGSVVFKLGNLKALDNSIEGKGFVNGSKTDRIVFEKYINQPVLLYEKKDIILHAIVAENGPEYGLNLEKPLPEAELGKLAKESFYVDDKLTMQKYRDGQWAFRQALLNSYSYACCLSGIHSPEFLVASHIKPWSIDKDSRLDPQNGLILNVFLDRAFDKGFITVDAKNFTVRLSKKIDDSMVKFKLEEYAGKKIMLPHNLQRQPKKEFLEYHNDKIFRH